MPRSLLIAEEFAECRFDLPDGGRWVELIAGEVVRLEPPDDAHGTAVLNLSKAFAAVTSSGGNASPGFSGYACFDHLLVVRRGPDTVYSPPVSYYEGGPWFAELDEPISTAMPALVCEIASTNDRRHGMGLRVKHYLDAGARMVWVVDPVEKMVHVYQPDQPSRRLSEHETLSGRPVVPGFEIRVEDLFREPEWWKKPTPKATP
jgi:Uma2 family endonuclease